MTKFRISSPKTSNYNLEVIVLRGVIITIINLILSFAPLPIFAQNAASNIIKVVTTELEDNNLTDAKKHIEEGFAAIQNDSTSVLFVDLLVLKSRWQFANGNYQKALETINHAERLARKKNISPILATVLNWKGRCHIELFELDKAKKALTIAKRTFNDKNIKRSKLYNELVYHIGLLEITQHKYQKADTLFLELLANSELKNEQPLLFYTIQYQLGESKLEQELFKESEKLLLKLVEQIKKEFGDKHYLNIYVNHHLARVYEKMGQYAKGQATYQAALTVCEENYSIHHPTYGIILSNFGNLKIDEGAFKEAETLLLKAKQIVWQAFQATPRYAFVLAGLEELYQKMGQPEKELKYALEQKEIFLTAGRFSDYATSINNLSYTYQEQQAFDKANSLLNEGIDLLKKKNQTKTGIYAVLLMNYAGLNIDLGNYEKSAKSFEEAQQLLAEIYGKEHPWYAAVINNLASLYETIGKYQQAKALYIETEQIDRTTLGTKHPYYIHTTYNLAKINRLTEDIKESIRYYQTANQGQVNLIYNYYSGFDEATRLDYLKKTEENFHRFYSFVYDNYKEHPELSKDLQNINLAIKNLALDFSADNQAVVNEITDTTVTKKYKDWRSIKKQLSQSYIQSSEEQATAGINVKALEEQAELLEKELVRSKVVNTSQLADRDRTTFKELRSAIPSDAAVIDFIRFPYYARNRLTDSVFYGALINRTDFAQPKLIWLGEEKALKRFLRSNVRQNGGNYVENDRIGNDLYQQIWQPLLPYLKEVKNINISASGLLHKVAFAALSSERGPLLNKYNFTYYGNLRSFNSSIQESELPQSIALFGGANFTLDSIALTQIAQQQKENKLVNLIVEPAEILARKDINNTRSAVVFNYLFGTKKEVDNITQQFKTHNWTAQSFTATNALEENFKTLNGKKAPSILHIATHGYFFAPLKAGRKVPNNARGRIMSATNPLLRSGLAFTGANYSWKLGKSIPDLEDGILTAYEIANQNLTNTNLVVLSACETGLGDVVNGEGVFGLQRAFKMAGVKNMLISLWKVPDQQTQELMTTFYQFYLQSQDASQALYQAQLQMSAQYRPFYWAGFILAK